MSCFDPGEIFLRFTEVEVWGFETWQNLLKLFGSGKLRVRECGLSKIFQSFQRR